MIQFIKKEIVFVIGSIMMLGILATGPIRQQIAMSKKDTVYQVSAANVSQDGTGVTVTTPVVKKTKVVPVKNTIIQTQRLVRERDDDQNYD